MRFGHTTDCHVCRKEIVGDYHKYTCDIAGIDLEFYACQGDCNKKFRGDYIEPFDPIKNRFDIMDLGE